ncbi:MAG: MipA/OmpV family protein [Sphingomonas sp.]|nr:MipA/OmpV family protein [Sphingomonas sp.]
MTMFRSCRVLVFAAAALPLALAGPAWAQDRDEEKPGWIVTVGGGAQVFPGYPGADGVDVFPLPILGLRREGRPMAFEAPDQGWGFGLLGSDSPFDFGPAMQFQNKRRDRDVGAPVGEVGFTVEAGGFAQAFVTPNLRLRVEGRRGIGGHDGWVGDISADFVIRDDDNMIFSIGPRARIADGGYHRAYFGVTPAAATATGLPEYRPGGGFYAIGASAGLTRRLSREWGIYAYAGYDRLIGDAADSPLVRTFGSRDQFSGGIGLFYEFTVRP